MTGAHNVDGCNLHIPHKSWVQESKQDVSLGERLERENWSELERWANERLPNCGCSCFYQHKHFDATGNIGTAIPINAYTVVPVTSTFTVGDRNGWKDTRTTLLVVNWTVNLSDYSDGLSPTVEYGYGCAVDQDNVFIGGSHGFVHQDNGKFFWPLNITGRPTGMTEDELSSGSFTCFLNGPQPGPLGNRWGFNLGMYVGIDNAGAATFASFFADTYEYGLCSCEGEE